MTSPLEVDDSDEVDGFDAKTAVCVGKDYIVLRHLMKDPRYARKFLPYLRPEYFTRTYRTVEAGVITGDKMLKAFTSFFNKYDRLPSVEELVIEVDAKYGFNQNEDQEFIHFLKDIDGAALDPQYVEDVFQEFITTEFKHCHISCLINAMKEGLPTKHHTDAIENPPTFGDEAVPGLDSASEDYVDSLLEAMQATDLLMPFDLEFLNEYVEGVRRGTVNLILAGTGVGKTLMMCHLTAAYMKQGRNVLYLTMEMKQSMIHERVHANLLDMTTEDLRTLSKADFQKRRPKDLGRLISNEYQTGYGHTGHFRKYMAQLKARSNFTPDVVVVDYLGICRSEKNHATHAQKYDIVASIAEELRALAQETNTAIWSAIQVNRAGVKAQPDMSHISGSFQIGGTADVMLTLWVDEKLKNRFHLGIEKNRYGAGRGESAVIEVNYAKMKLYNISKDEVERRMKDKLTAMESKKAKKIVHDIDR